MKKGFSWLRRFLLQSGLLPTSACMIRCVAKALCGLGSTGQPKEPTYANRNQQ